MAYSIEVMRNWHSNRTHFLTPGTYRVPEDVSDEMAARAIDEKAAKRVGPVAASVVRKMPAPENKVVTASESKTESKKTGLTGATAPSSLPPVDRAKPKKT